MIIRLFGRLADLLGRQVALELPAACSVGELRAALAERNPEAEAEIGSPRARACVEDTIVGADYLVGVADTVDFLPPVSGG